MAVPGTRFDSAPLQTKLDIDDNRWRKWFQDMWALVNAIRLPLPISVTVGASPFTYQFANGGSASILVNGGTVSLIEWSRDGTTFYKVGTTTDSMYTVSSGDYIRVTYTVIPTVKVVLR